MIDTNVQSANVDVVEAVLRDELAQADAAAETVVPVLRHLLANEDNSLFSDEIVARIRGMLRHLSTQLLEALDTVSPEDERVGFDEEDIAALSGTFVDSPAFLSHLHALALEWQLSERLHARIGLDPVLSPLIQALVASKDAETAALAMRLLASQARFCQSQRRMELALKELPGDLLHSALLSLRTLAAADEEADRRAAAAEQAIRSSYDEGSGRLGMISRLVMGMGGGAIAALSVTHAGVAMFLSALSIGSGLDRDATILSTNETQLGRLALALRSAGLRPGGVEEQFLALCPDFPLPDGFDRIGSDRASAILAASGSYREG